MKDVSDHKKRNYGVVLLAMAPFGMMLGLILGIGMDNIALGVALGASFSGTFISIGAAGMAQSQQPEPVLERNRKLGILLLIGVLILATSIGFWFLLSTR